MEGIENLPDDCLQLIFNHLNEGDLEAVSVVCKDFLKNLNLSKQNLKLIHPRVSVLSAQLKRFRGIKKIDLTNFHGDKDEAILEIARSGLGLEALDISCRQGIRTESLEELGSNSKMRNLKVLNLHSVCRLQDNDLVVIANSFSKLEELRIGYKGGYYPSEESLNKVSSSKFPTDYGIEFLASKLKHLKKITLSGKYIVSDQSLLALSLSCLLLKDVTIYCNSLTENGIGFLLRNRQNLECLSIGHVKISRSTITIENSISHAKALTSLEFVYMDVSDKLLNAIAKAKLPLKKFKLTICTNFTSQGLLTVLANYQLTELLINGYGCSIVDRDMNLLLNGNVSRLTHIEISPFEMTKSVLFLLSAKCPSLEEIRMSYNTNGHLQELDELGFLFPNLRVLDLSLFSHYITSITIKAILKSCKFLRKLTLKGYREANVTEADKSEFPEVNLEDLTISDSSISDEGLADIVEMCPRLVSLDLSYCDKLSAESVKQIVKNITTLNCLGVRSYDCTNLGELLDWMLSTGNLASLKKIYVGIYYAPSQEQLAKFFHHGCLLLRW